MAGKNIAEFGIYKNVAQAESAVDQIVQSRTVAGGFQHNDISVLLPGHAILGNKRDLAHPSNDAVKLTLAG